MRGAFAIAMLLALGGLLLAGCGTSNTDKLTATTWYLVSGGERSPSWQWTVPAEAQSRFTIQFETDGTFHAEADCNQLVGDEPQSGRRRTPRLHLGCAPESVAQRGGDGRADRDVHTNTDGRVDGHPEPRTDSHPDGDSDADVEYVHHQADPTNHADPALHVDSIADAHA